MPSSIRCALRSGYGRRDKEDESRPKSLSIFFGERLVSKVAAPFYQAADARSAAKRVVHDGQLPDRDMLVLASGDQDLGRKLEPEDRGIFSSMIRAHVSLGSSGC